MPVQLACFGCFDNIDMNTIILLKFNGKNLLVTYLLCFSVYLSYFCNSCQFRNAANFSNSFAVNVHWCIFVCSYVCACVQHLLEFAFSVTDEVDFGVFIYLQTYVLYIFPYVLFVCIPCIVCIYICIYGVRHQLMEA